MKNPKSTQPTSTQNNNLSSNEGAEDPPSQEKQEKQDYPYWLDSKAEYGYDEEYEEYEE
jgi:hypothetical protein